MPRFGLGCSDGRGRGAGGLVPITDVRGAKEMVRSLATLRSKALPYAVRNGLTQAAVETRAIWQGVIRATFTLRNSYTVRSVLFERTTGDTVGAMRSKVGSTTEYMDKQEEGGTVSNNSGRKPIPGPVAAGLAPGAKRTSAVRARFRLGAISVGHPTLKGTRHQRNAIAIAYAVRTGNKRAVLERPGGRKALFLIAGPKARPTTRLLWDVSRSSVRVHAQPTLQRALDVVKPKLPHMLTAAVLQQLNRFNIPHT